MKKTLAILVALLLLAGIAVAADLTIQLKKTNPGIVGERSAELNFSIANMDMTHNIQCFLLCRSPDDATVGSSLGAGVGSGAQYLSPMFTLNKGPSEESITLTLDADSPGDKSADCTIKYIPYKVEDTASKKYLKMNGEYVAEPVDEDYRQLRLDKVLPFAQKGVEDAKCPDEKPVCTSAEIIALDGTEGNDTLPVSTTYHEAVCGDGKIDEGCPCSAGETQECGDDTGECKKGVQTCENGLWGQCEGAVESVKEVCDDGKDNDCDGMIDMGDDACSNTEATYGLSATCYDHIENQDEEAIDCGGEDCIPCEQVTCNDKLWNGHEEGVDCGGPCDVCYEAGQKVSEPKEEVEKKHRREKEEKKGLPFMFYLLVFIIILIVLFFGTVFFKMKKTGKPFNETIKGMFRKKPSGKEGKPSPFGAKKPAAKPSAQLTLRHSRKY